MTRYFHIKWGIIVALLAIVCLAGGCNGADAPTAANVTGGAEDGGQTAIPDILPFADNTQYETRTVSLYYRMREEQLLARETRKINVPYDQRLEKVLIKALIDGPSINLLDLTGVFIAGTNVVKIEESGDMLIVTLSRNFLGTPADISQNWRNDPSLRNEVLQRRQLALESIVNTITENTRYTSVQLLVQSGGDDTSGQRIARSEVYMDGGDELLSPVKRSEENLLTHYNTAGIILECWKNKDFDRLYRYVSGRPTEETFVQELTQYDRALLSYTLSAGTVSEDGASAVLLATLQYKDVNGTAAIENYPIHIKCDGGLWKIEYENLLRLMEAM